MTTDVYWRDTYNIFGPLFYELVGYYESNYDREPEHIINDYEKVKASSEILPIYGKTELPKYIMYLVQLPIVMRLREIRQLSSTHILFPGATHTRYEHSLGVMQKSTNILSKLAALPVKKGENNYIKIGEDEEVILRIASLLHDLGHPAWGHALDGITGFVVELLGQTLETYTPKKLDSAITLYLLLKNEQIKKALTVCSQEILDKDTKDILEKVVAQIILEEKRPLFNEMATNDLMLRKIHLLTTIIGTYHKVGGINGDRIDWIARDAHHANLGAQLEPKDLEMYLSFRKKVETDNFKVDRRNSEFCFVDDKEFRDSMEYLREKIYEKFYEGLERSFSDSLLIRIFHSATNVLHIAGNSFASPSITARAIMGYLLMPDDRVKEYTAQILYRARQNQRLLDSDGSTPTVLFISKSYSLLRLFDESMVYIMHHLASPTVRMTDHSEMLGLDFTYVKLDQIGKTMIVVTAKAFSNLLERALAGSKSENAINLAVVFQDILFAARTNPITALKIHALEASLEKQLPDANVNLLVNYYFFRRLDDCFKDKVTDLSSLKTVLEVDLEVIPIFFILTSKEDNKSIKQIFDVFSTQLIGDFLSYFQAIET